MPEVATAPASADVCTVVEDTGSLQKSLPPTKIMGKEGCPCAKVWVTKKDGRQMMRICADKDFNWTESVKPNLPGNPDWCPASHFGYLEKGSMDVKMQNGDIVKVRQGASYFIAPGHLPTFHEDTVMIEFSQDQELTKMVESEKK